MLAQDKDISVITRPRLSEKELESFQHFIASEFKLKLNWYNSESSQRRLQKAIKKLNLNSLKSLEHQLQSGEMAFQRFVSEFTVNVTEIFREPASLNELKVSVLPFYSRAKEFKVLLVGSSTGEELATLCILLKENGLLERSKILATDLNSQVLEQARQPKLSKSDLIQGNINYLKAGGFRELGHYFIGAGSHVFLEVDLLQNVTFREFDICHSKLDEDFDLILCKNVLIYFQYDQQHQLINNLSRHLKQGGFLALGEKESILGQKELNGSFASVSSEHNIYRKIN